MLRNMNGGGGSGYGTGDAYMSDDDDGGECVEETEKPNKNSSARENKEQRYIVLTEDIVAARQKKDTAKVAEVLSITPGSAAVLLRHFKWTVTRVQEEWFSDERHVRDAVGLPPPDGGTGIVPISSRRRRLTCSICFDVFFAGAGRMRSAGCAHYYCDDCWSGYIRAALDGAGTRCLSLRCPDPSCPAAVVRELVDAVADGADRARYARFALRSYVEDSGGRIRWCPAAGCDRAFELLAGDGSSADVFCHCRHGFCFRCGEEAHRPVSCGTVCAWLAKNVSDAENANWLLANTKHCPKCRQPIEKNQGCNHMSCHCGHHFCCLCLQPAGGRNHYACDGYRPRPAKYDDAGGGGKVMTMEDEKRQQAKASLDRYLYHYERWAGNHKSLQVVFKDMAELEKMATALRRPATDLGFLTEAYEQIADGRRVLRWAHAYGYYLDPQRDVIKRFQFEHLEQEANSWLERLHKCAELERKELFKGGKDEAATAEMFMSYQKKLANLTRVTGTFLENLVNAFETDLLWPPVPSSD